MNHQLETPIINDFLTQTATKGVDITLETKLIKLLQMKQDNTLCNIFKVENKDYHT